MEIAGRRSRCRNQWERTVNNAFGAASNGDGSGVVPESIGRQIAGGMRLLFRKARIICPFAACAHRLAVRTAPSHGANRGSIPLGRTSKIKHLGAFDTDASNMRRINNGEFQRRTAAVIDCCSGFRPTILVAESSASANVCQSACRPLLVSRIRTGTRAPAGRRTSAGCGRLSCSFSAGSSRARCRPSPRTACPGSASA